MKITNSLIALVCTAMMSPAFAEEQAQTEAAPKAKKLGSVSEATYAGLQDLAEDLGGLKYTRAEDNQIIIVTAKEKDGEYNLYVTETGGYASSETPASIAGQALEPKEPGQATTEVDRCYAADSGVVLAPSVWRDNRGTTWYPNASKQQCEQWYSYAWAARRCTNGSFQRSSYGTLSTDGCKCFQR